MIRVLSHEFHRYIQNKLMQVKRAAWFATWEATQHFFQVVFFTFEMFTLPKMLRFPPDQHGWIWENLCGFPVSHLADTDALSAALGHRSSTPAARAVPRTLERLPQCNICGLEDFCLTWQTTVHCTCIICVISWLMMATSNLDPQCFVTLFQDSSLPLFWSDKKDKIGDVGGKCADHLNSLDLQLLFESQKIR